MSVLTVPGTTSGTERHGADVAHLAPKGHIVEGYVLGKHVEAICGVRHIPTRDPDHLPLCSGCREVAATTYGICAH